MMKAVQYTPGGAENLYIGEVPLPVLKEREILIKVYATGVNRADLLQRQGHYPPPPGESDIIGLEAAGIVEKLGPNVTKWKTGDRVMCLLSGGGYAEFVAVCEEHALAVPQGVPFTKAAAIPENWLTAYQLLMIADVKPGEKVLIHASASGVGTAAIQLATKMFGAKVYSTAGNDKKLQYTKELGATEAFNYKNEFKSPLMAATGGTGVDVILDCVGASMWEQNFGVIAMDGRWILFGLMGGADLNGNVLGKVLLKRLRLQGSTLRTRLVEYKSNLISKFATVALPSVWKGDCKLVVDTVFPMSKISDAHTYMESNANIGKIVIQVRNEEGSSLVN